MPAPSASGRSNGPTSLRQHAEATGEREREGKKPGRSARLRDRDEVGERREEERQQHHGEDGERPADDVRRPAAARREARRAE